MDVDQYQWVVVGGGVAGGRAVEVLARSKQRTALVSAEPVLPYSRPPLSKGVLCGKKSFDDLVLRSTSYYHDKGIDLLLGDAGVQLNADAQQLELASGRTLSFEKLLLAPGARPAKLPVPGEHLDGVHYFRTIDDANRLKDCLVSSVDGEVVIIGGGFVGCEIASALRTFGRQVHIVESSGGLMVRALGEKVGQLMADLHRDAGVNLHLGVQVLQICGNGQARSVVLSNGEELACGAVVIGIGAVPSVAWLETSGLKLSEGIVVDEYAKTSAANIFAAGDAARFWSRSLDRYIRVEHESNALNQSVAAARNMLGGKVVHDPIPYVWSTQYDREIWCLGEPVGYDDVELRVDKARWEILALYCCRQMPVAAVGVNAPLALAYARQLFQRRERFSLDQLAAAVVQDLT